MGGDNTTEATRRLAITHPVVQGPFGGGLSTVRLAATVSNMGGLGSFGAQGLAPREIELVVREIRSLTSRPFAINLWIPHYALVHLSAAIRCRKGGPH
jgi:nitronate monooxygenase